MAVASTFRKVSRKQVKASIMIEGLQGSGKSGLALCLAMALASSPDKVYAIDTENQSLDLFDGIKAHTGELFKDFNKVDLTSDDGFKPSNYAKLRKAAIDAGAEVVIMDSITHMWNRKGGMLDLVTKASRNGNGKDFNAWGTDENVMEKELIFDLVRSSKAHIITTVRDKEKFSMELDESTGKNKVVSLGEQQVQQDGLKYEPDLVLRMVSAGYMDGEAPVAVVLKSRYAIFKQGVEYKFTKELLDNLRDYLAEGIDPSVIIAQQKKDYIDAIKEYCNTPARKSVWQAIKKDTGFTGKLEEMPIDILKFCFHRLLED